MVNVARIGTATREFGAWLKAGGYKYFVETRPATFHGINPKLTYPPSGKSFELPRFRITKEMKEAIQLNKIAIQEAKAGKVEYTYPKATAEDLKRLTSQSIEDSYSRVTWTNPKDGKVYHLLKQGETPEGKVVIRILDEQGAFIKEAEVVPKNITIIDDFSSDCTVNNGIVMSHGHLVRVFAQRNNPFAKYQFIDSTPEGKSFFCNDTLIKGLLNAVNKLKNNKYIDYISISQGFSDRLGHSNISDKEKLILDGLKKLSTDNGTRVIAGAGNGGPEEFNVLLQGQVEGVGSIAKNGKISEFSSSRNSKLTQHYELGEGYFPKFVLNDKGEIIGLNVTGISGCDYMYNFREISKKEISKLNKLKAKVSKIKVTISSLPDNWLNRIRINYLTKRCEKFNNKIEQLESGTRFQDIYDPKNLENEFINGTSYSTPICTAKLTLNDMMQGVV